MFVESSFQIKAEQYKDLLREAEREQILREATGGRKNNGRTYKWALPRWRPRLSPSKLNWQRGVRIWVGAGVLFAILSL